MVKIYCKNTGTSKEFEEGTYLGDMVQAFEFDKPYDILAAKVNNVAQGLRFKVYHSLDVEFLDYRTYTGRNFYCRSLCFLLFKAVKDLFPESKLTIRRPISKGYYCAVDKGDSSPLTEADVDAVRERMAKIVEDDIPFRRHEARVEDAIKTFTALGAMDKVKLLETCGDVYITYYTLDGTADYYYDELVPSSGYLKTWSVSLYKEGILLRVPDRHHPEDLAPFREQPKTFEVFKESHKWNGIMGLGNVGDVNESILSGKASDLIQIAEALQEKKIVQIAEEIERRHCDPVKPLRLVLITGPTSSGKSTFCKRLSIQLRPAGSIRSLSRPTIISSTGSTLPNCRTDPSTLTISTRSTMTISRKIF